jgi:hypothetical protein
MGMRAKASVRARNVMMMLGIAVLIVGDLCYALVPSMLGEAGAPSKYRSFPHLGSLHVDCNNVLLAGRGWRWARPASLL